MLAHTHTQLTSDVTHTKNNTDPAWLVNWFEFYNDARLRPFQGWLVSLLLPARGSVTFALLRSTFSLTNTQTHRQKAASGSAISTFHLTWQGHPSERPPRVASQPRTEVALQPFARPFRWAQTTSQQQQQQPFDPSSKDVIMERQLNRFSLVFGTLRALGCKEWRKSGGAIGLKWLNFFGASFSG